MHDILGIMFYVMHGLGHGELEKLATETIILLLS